MQFLILLDLCALEQQSSMKDKQLGPYSQSNLHKFFMQILDIYKMIVVLNIGHCQGDPFKVPLIS